MIVSFLSLPARETKPRKTGLTVLLDNGVPTRQFIDTVDSFHEYVDLIKFGWCTSVLDGDLGQKIEHARRRGVESYFGGTLFEKALLQRKLEHFRGFCRDFGCRFVEISNGTIDLSNREKAAHIADFAKEFQVFSEVGYKDVQRSLELSPAKWIEYIREDLAAGAQKVIMEARESGRSGICRADGELRYGLVVEILDSGIPPERLIFEAPNKDLQVYFINRLGPNVNLANISFGDVVGLETLRLGLRSDTLLLFEERGK
jgi:phosphosulfolactate synthase